MHVYSKLLFFNNFNSMTNYPTIADHRYRRRYGLIRGGLYRSVLCNGATTLERFSWYTRVRTFGSLVMIVIEISYTLSSASLS